jgi:hypothetical protein
LLQKRIDGVNSKPLEGERPQIESRSLLIAEFINGIGHKQTNLPLDKTRRCPLLSDAVEKVTNCPSSIFLL